MSFQGMDFEGENVLITGVTGFVGSYLANFLLKENSNVYGLMKNKSEGTKPRNLTEAGIYDDIEIIKGDVTDVSSLANAIDASEPDHVFHLAAQSYVPYSFNNPLDTTNINSMGTMNLLEAISLSNLDPNIVFAGSSEEYGLVITSEHQYEDALEERGNIFPKPEKIPEIPVKETNPLRPMSPYGVSKVFGDQIMRNYFHSYGLKTKVSRAFNHEGARRGENFVTSVITKQAMRLKYEEQDRINIGNVNAFRDWSHVKDIVKGYCLIAKKGKAGDVYNQGSSRVNSVLSYILLSLEQAGYSTKSLETFENDKKIENPSEISTNKLHDYEFPNTKADRLLLNEEIKFSKQDQGIAVETDKGKIRIKFEEDRFRPAEVPILLSDTSKIRELGFEINHSLQDIIKDQINYYMNPERREL